MRSQINDPEPGTCDDIFCPIRSVQCETPFGFEIASYIFIALNYYPQFATYTEEKSVDKSIETCKCNGTYSSLGLILFRLLKSQIGDNFRQLVNDFNPYAVENCLKMNPSCMHLQPLELTPGTRKEMQAQLNETLTESNEYDEFQVIVPKRRIVAGDFPTFASKGAFRMISLAFMIIETNHQLSLLFFRENPSTKAISFVQLSDFQTTSFDIDALKSFENSSVIAAFFIHSSTFYACNNPSYIKMPYPRFPKRDDEQFMKYLETIHVSEKCSICQFILNCLTVPGYFQMVKGLSLDGIYISFIIDTINSKSLIDSLTTKVGANEKEEMIRKAEEANTELSKFYLFIDFLSSIVKNMASTDSEFDHTKACQDMITIFTITPVGIPIIEKILFFLAENMYEIFDKLDLKEEENLICTLLFCAFGKSLNGNADFKSLCPSGTIKQKLSEGRDPSTPYIASELTFPFLNNYSMKLSAIIDNFKSITDIIDEGLENCQIGDLKFNSNYIEYTSHYTLDKISWI